MAGPTNAAQLTNTTSLTDAVKLTDAAPAPHADQLADAAPAPGAALPTAGQAWVLHLRGQHEEAANLARDALAANPSDARSAYIFAHALEALDRTEEAGAFLRLHGVEHPRTGTAPLGLGQLRLKERKFSEAESLLTLALKHFRDMDNASGEIVALCGLAELRSRAEQPEEAQILLKTAMAAAERLKEQMTIASIHLQTGLLLISKGEQQGAAEQFRQLLETAQTLQLPMWIGDAHLQLSRLARWQMDLESAMFHREAALTAYREANDWSGEARALHYIAVIHLIHGELTRAMDLLHVALHRAREAGDQGEVYSCLGDLGALNYLLGNEALAIDQYEEAIGAAGDLLPKTRIAGMLSNIGLILVDQLRFSEAQTYFERALAILETASDRRTEAPILASSGRCLCMTGNYKEGIQRLEKAAVLARTWDMSLKEAQTLSDIAQCYLSLGDLEAAAESFEKASQVAKAAGSFMIQAGVLPGQARVARMQGEREEALRLFEEAMEVFEGVRARSQGSQRVQTHYFGRKSYIYEETVDLLWEVSQLEPAPDAQDAQRPAYARQAFAVAQRAKARSFLDLLTEANVDLRFRADLRYQQHEHGIEERIEQLIGRGETSGPGKSPSIEVQIAELQEELDILEDELRRKDPRYAELKYPRPCSLAELQDHILEPGELLLEYFLGDSASYAWAVTREEFRFLRLSSRAVIEAQVRDLLPLLRDYNILGANPTYLIDPVLRLSRELIEPVAAQCQHAKRVIVAPHGILHYLPFEILLTENPSRKGATLVSDEDSSAAEISFASLPYLIMQTDLIYVPSVSALALLRTSLAEKPTAGTSGILLVGNPSLPEAGQGSIFAQVTESRRATPLPFAAEELASIGALFPPDQTRVLTGKLATPAALGRAVKGNSYEFVHIAAHGLFNERRPRFSGLLLSPDEAINDDGFLTAGEVFGLELTCDQIVLSACSSALGERVTGEGLIGLTRAFLYAGSRNVVAALWEVSGEATAYFMRNLYEIALREGGGRAHAVAEAKRHMIQGTGESGGKQLHVGALSGSQREVCLSHPYFWAAFVLTGEGQ